MPSFRPDQAGPAFAEFTTGEPGACADAVARYAARYTQPKDRGPERRVVTMVVERILASGGLSP